MRRFNHSAFDPATDLAWDDALLHWLEAGAGVPVLRFWEPASHFVVVGYGNAVGKEVKVDVCQARGIPVLRRCSGGGTVMQGPGCLNYALVVPAIGEFASIQSTNRYIMERHRSALEGLLGEPVLVCGTTDLVLQERKFSGNAQRRLSRAVLFHGTFLCGLDLELMSECLRPPSQSPAYRQDREHRDFVRNLPISTPTIMAALSRAWGVEGELKVSIEEQVRSLVTAQYGCREWIERR